jgi:hypothetical protein
MNREQFLSITGLKHSWQHVIETGKASYATIATDLDSGDIRVLFLRIKRRANNKLKISCKYYYHNNDKRNRPISILDIFCHEDQRDIKIESIKILGAEIKVSDDKHFFPVAIIEAI